MTGCYITAGRTYWTLSRDNATPFNTVFAKIHPQRKNPFNATIFCGCTSTALACIYIGSATAFNAFVGAFVVASSLSYLAAILSHMLTGRRSVEPGEFWMHGWLGWSVNLVSCGYISTFIVIFCCPFSMPVDAASMNYTSLMMGGLSLFVAVLWFFKKDQYIGPEFVPRESTLLAKDAI